MGLECAEGADRLDILEVIFHLDDGAAFDGEHLQGDPDPLAASLLRARRAVEDVVHEKDESHDELRGPDARGAGEVQIEDQVGDGEEAILERTRARASDDRRDRSVARAVGATDDAEGLGGPLASGGRTRGTVSSISNVSATVGPRSFCGDACLRAGGGGSAPSPRAARPRGLRRSRHATSSSETHSRRDPRAADASLQGGTSANRARERATARPAARASSSSPTSRSG